MKVEVTLAGVQGGNVHECSRQVKIKPDVSLEEVVGKISYDAVILPGGRYGSPYLCQVNLKRSLKNNTNKQHFSKGCNFIFVSVKPCRKAIARAGKKRRHCGCNMRSADRV